MRSARLNSYNSGSSVGSRNSLSLKSGDRVEVFNDGRTSPGFIKKINRDKTYSIIFDNGTEGSMVSRKSIRAVDMSPENFMKACEEGILEAVKLYVAIGGNVNYEDMKGMTGLEVACLTGANQVVDFLLQSDSIQIKPNAFFAACSVGYGKVVAEFLAQSGDANIVTRDGENGLDLALKRGLDEVVELLLDKSPISVSYAAFKNGIERGYFPLVCKYMEQNTMEVAELGRTFDAAFKHGHIEIMSHAVRYRTLHNSLGGGSINQPLSPSQNKRAEDVKRHQILKMFQQQFKRNCFDQEIGNDMDLKHVRFLRADVFINQGRFVSYDECEKGGLHVSGEELTPQSTVLMIVHPWAERHDNLEHKAPFQQAVKFIKEFPQRTDLGRGHSGQVDLVWFEGSCLCPPPRKRVSGAGIRMITTKDAAVAPSLPEFLQSELHVRHMRGLPLAVLSSTYCLALPRMMVFEGFETKAKEEYNRFQGLIYSDIDDLLSNNLCNTQILMCVISGCKVFCMYNVLFPHEFCLCNFKRWDISYLDGEALKIQDKPYTDSDVEKPDPAMNVWFRSASIGALNRIKQIDDKRQLWYGILRECWFLEIVDPTVHLAKCVLSVLDISDNDPDLMRRIWAFDLHEKDMAQNRLTVMDEDGKDWDLSFDNIILMMGHLDKGRDKALCLNTLLLTIAFCMGKDPEQALPTEDSSNAEIRKTDESSSDAGTPAAFINGMFESIFSSDNESELDTNTARKFAPGTLRTKETLKR